MPEPRFTADADLFAVHDTVTDLYAPFAPEIVDVTIDEIAIEFNSGVCRVGNFGWVPREILDA